MSRELLVRGHPRRSPTHPGEILREDVLPALDLTVSEAARQLRVTRQTLHTLSSPEKAAGEVAERVFDKVFHH